MRKEVLYSLKGIYREDFEIEGYRFGGGEQAACIVGAMRGNEVQQLYICSQLIKILKELEAHGAIAHNKEILVIPSANRYSMNIEKRFWPVDNSDINRMFPGDVQGDTTKQIAAAIFESSKGYSYGIQFASFYMPGDFIPHVRMMETGYQNASLANLFGLQYVLIRKPKPMDTVTLNYNWQMNGTNAFSIYTNSTDMIDDKSARQAVSSVLRFLTRMGILKYNNHSGYIASVINECDLTAVKTYDAGFYKRLKEPGDPVFHGETIARVLDPCEGTVKSEIVAQTDGIVFFAHTAPMVMGNEVVYKIIRRMHE
ncbi:MAG: M14 family metallopeptidase [Eubacteriales bacterium]|nr:M14 family metallopeptidase [Eubacteriales bacterium]